ncbi:tRNA pseudouridine(55) synthase TruB [Robiginitomaculum antarcticum]|uniref:tRNA pseudouridine(55) synthase TruB n=1 Tax=Robiginitomaculum antarcticum TaxID=437507 RepID=UPI000378AD83|nr:tRNA pseudouridine(55) synthase TruB [Robiginitomaculum antarcticum]
MARKRKGNPVHGWINFNKPYGMGSTQAVGKLRWLMSAQKAGHAGTLDPLASGVLPIALGEATKTVPFMMDAAKSYEVEITWGEHRDTLDAEGVVTATSDVRPSEAQILTALPQFIGEIDQIPPKYSAIKVDGKRAYDLARAGQDVILKSRRVRIDDIRLISAGENAARLFVDCGKGTYIRSLAADLADALGTAGYVSQLVRTRVGPFKIDAALGLDFIEQSVHKAAADQVLLAVETALDDIPALAITKLEQDDVKQGRAIALPLDFAKHMSLVDRPEIQDGKPVLILVKYEGKAVALCEASGGTLYPKRVFMM